MGWRLRRTLGWLDEKSGGVRGRGDGGVYVVCVWEVWNDRFAVGFRW